MNNKGIIPRQALAITKLTI